MGVRAKINIAYIHYCASGIFPLYMHSMCKENSFSMLGLTIRNDTETDIISGVVGDPVKCSLHCVGEKLRHSTLILNFNTYSPSCSGIK